MTYDDASATGRVTLTIPAADDYLLVVRLATSGLLSLHQLDLDQLDEAKTAVQEACYALIHQKHRPESVRVEVSGNETVCMNVYAEGRRQETAERLPNLKLCRCVMEAIIEKVELVTEGDDLSAILLSQSYRV